MLNPDDYRLGPQVKPAGLLGLRDLRGKRRPVRALLVALIVEAILDRRGAPVARHRVKRHPARADALVAESLGPVAHHLEVVVGRRCRDPVGARDAQPGLGLVVVGLEVGQADRPVEQAGAVDGAMLRPDPELPFLEAWAATGPVNGGAADRLAGPGGQVRELLGYPPRARRGALIQPGELVERSPLVVDEVFGLMMCAGLNQDALRALLADLVR